MTVESCLVKLYLLRPEVRDPVPEAEGRRLEANDLVLVARAGGRGPRAECRVSSVECRVPSVTFNPRTCLLCRQQILPAPMANI